MQNKEYFWQLSPAIFAVLSPAGAFEDVNPAFSSILGWPTGEASRHTLVELLHPQTDDAVRCVLSAVASDGATHSVETQLRHQDGSYRWLCWDLIANDGRIFAVGRDITRQKQQEQQNLRAQEARLQMALDAGGMGAWHWDIEADTSHWWPGMDRIHGLPPATNPGSMAAYQAFVHADDRDRLASAVANALKEKRGHQIEYRVVWPDHSVHWVEGRGELFFDEQGNVSMMAGICMDITKRKRTERDLRFVARASEELASFVDYRATLDKIAKLAVPDFADWCAVDILDGDNHLQRLAVAHVNPDKVKLAYALHQQYPPDPTLPTGTWGVIRSGKAEMVTEITHPMLDATIKDATYLAALKDLGLCSYIGIPLKNRSETYRVITFITAESKRLYGDDDLALAEDLGRRASIAIENSTLYQQLYNADRRKDIFLATLAHELRNPLVPIRNSSQIICAANYDREITKSVMVTLDRQAAQLTKIVEELLDVSRITTGKVQLSKEIISLQNLIHAAVETCRQRLASGNRSIALRLPEHPVLLSVDTVRMTQVLVNILDNAIKFTNNGGEIDIAIEVTDTSHIVSIRDNGRGIAKDQLKAIFTMFTQEKSSQNDTNGGLGIGLAIVESLVKLHDGHVEARSEGIGYGSEFRIRLPKSAAAQASRFPSTQSTEEKEMLLARSAKRILLVEDNQDVASSMCSLLAALGYNVAHASNGTEAIAHATVNFYDVVLLDIGLPDISGIEVARNMRRSGHCHHSRIIALSGWRLEQTGKDSADGFFDEAWIKPVGIEQLQQL